MNNRIIIVSHGSFIFPMHYKLEDIGIDSIEKGSYKTFIRVEDRFIEQKI